jgi:small redox-active disulfide protein 2
VKKIDRQWLLTEPQTQKGETSMKKIQILGTGCPKCKQLTQNVELAAQELGIECEIEKVTGINDIMAFGVMVTPAIVVDGEVKMSGKRLSSEQIKPLLQ